MSDYQEENPYASPEGAAEAAVPEIRGIWRDGDELVILPRDMKAPKACWITNRSKGIAFLPISCGNLVFALLLFVTVVPVAGMALLLVGLLILMINGYIERRKLHIWLSRGHFLRYMAVTLLFTPFYVVGVCWSNAFLFGGSAFLGILAIPLVAVYCWLMIYVDGILLGLHARYTNGGLIRVRGVHADYLARLPVYNESSATTAMTTEPGKSPIADSAQ